MIEVKALSVKQPYAQLLVLGLKRVETRPRQTRHRGLLAIHATKAVPGTDIQNQFPEAWEAMQSYIADRPGWIDDNYHLTCGAVVGTVNLTACVPIEKLYGTEYDTPQERAFGDWSPGRFGWIVENPLAFDCPDPARGMLGLWNWTPSKRISAKYLANTADSGRCTYFHCRRNGQMRCCRYCQNPCDNPCHNNPTKCGYAG